ncbi:MAG: tRNA (adenosine(37)-N6)-dimethylallyltransferase MiaA [Bacteroidetes bacterium]|nr:tRNA (adenosine(37)-N6)-dimethylallyltransferase MiaA [Bacteroidota bacterium]
MPTPINPKTLIAIIGATASGKTEVAIAVAKHFNTCVISADSRQFFREMNIGTNKPTAAQLAEVPHHFINNLSITDAYNSGQYERDVLQLLPTLFDAHDVVVLCGGSTLYLSAIFNGIDEMPNTPNNIREQLKADFKEKGLPFLQAQLMQKDPAYFATADTQNPARLMRALEVIATTGKPYSAFRKKEKPTRDFNIIKIGLDVVRDDLYHRINQRCDAMLAAGLLEEVKSLYEFKDLNALQTVGYKEFFDVIDAKTTLETATEKFKQNTRNYAKRQLTWFRKEDGVQWMKGEEVVGYVKTIC